jgi:hypothetical protein
LFDPLCQLLASTQTILLVIPTDICLEKPFATAIEAITEKNVKRHNFDRKHNKSDCFEKGKSLKKTKKLKLAFFL